MKEAKERKLLRRIRGSFAPDFRTKWFNWFYILLFGVALPIFFAFALYHDGMTGRPNADQWTFIVLIPFSSSLGWLFWKYLGDEYEFTGHAVVVRRHGKSIREIAVSDVQEARLSTDRFGNKRLTLKGSTTELAIQVYPSLRNEIEKLSTEQSGAAYRR